MEELPLHGAGCQQRQVERNEGKKSKCSDRRRGAHRIQRMAAHQHAVHRPAQGRQHEQQVTLPDVPPIERMQEAAATDQRAPQQDQHQSECPGACDPCAQIEQGQQRSPQRQAAREQYRRVAGRRIHKTAIGQQRVEQSGEQPRYASHAQRQGRQAKQRRPAGPGRAIASPDPPAQRQQDRPGAKQARQGDVKGSQHAATGGVGRGPRDHDERGPDQHGDHGGCHPHGAGRQLVERGHALIIDGPGR